MTATGSGAVRYDVTRIALIDALADVPLTRDLNLEARGRMADALLGQMPEASAAAFYMEGVKAERQRVIDLADERNATYVVECRRPDCEHASHQRGFAELVEDSAEFGPQP